MSAARPDQPLSFDAVDGLALAHERGLLREEQVKDRWRAEELGPLVELSSLTAQGRVPSWFIERRLALSPRLAELTRRIHARRTFTPLHASADCGLFQADDESADAFSGFRLSAMKAAEAAGFPLSSARQLAAAMGELRSNIRDHSQAVATGYLAFAWQPGLFEFVSVDVGIGVLASLKTCPEFCGLEDHGAALLAATTEGKSRFGDGSGHGTGFRDLFIGLMNHRGDLRFHSGNCALELHGRSPSLESAVLKQRAAISGLAITVSCSPDT